MASTSIRCRPKSFQARWSFGPSDGVPESDSVAWKLGLPVLYFLSISLMQETIARLDCSNLATSTCCEGESVCSREIFVRASRFRCRHSALFHDSSVGKLERCCQLGNEIQVSRLEDTYVCTSPSYSLVPSPEALRISFRIVVIETKSPILKPKGGTGIFDSCYCREDKNCIGAIGKRESSYVMRSQKEASIVIQRSGCIVLMRHLQDDVGGSNSPTRLTSGIHIASPSAWRLLTFRDRKKGLSLRFSMSGINLALVATQNGRSKLWDHLGKMDRGFTHL